MNKPYLTFDDFPENLANALKRAQAWQSVNRLLNLITITSRNKEAPLTEDEKEAIIEHLYSIKCPYRVVFDENRVIPYE